jgi:hypothetical protein
MLSHHEQRRLTTIDNELSADARLRRLARLVSGQYLSTPDRLRRAWYRHRPSHRALVTVAWVTGVLLLLAAVAVDIAGFVISSAPMIVAGSAAEATALLVAALIWFVRHYDPKGRSRRRSGTVARRSRGRRT